ncbi:MAG TPA: hypothetical protein VFA18_05055 [Gemmataceae bacterium]|nr:hypothetical protein [Gemmataceae bacterium]
MARRFRAASLNWSALAVFAALGGLLVFGLVANGLDAVEALLACLFAVALLALAWLWQLTVTGRGSEERAGSGKGQADGDGQGV